MAKPQPKDKETEQTPPDTQPTPPESKSETKPKMSHKLAVRKERQGQ